MRVGGLLTGKAAEINASFDSETISDHSKDRILQNPRQVSAGLPSGKDST